jgi:hypothetical protein
MITASLRPPFRDSPADTHAAANKIVAQAEEQLDQLLANKQLFAPQTLLKLTIEKRFLRVRAIYYRVFGKIL